MLGDTLAAVGLLAAGTKRDGFAPRMIQALLERDRLATGPSPAGTVSTTGAAAEPLWAARTTGVRAAINASADFNRLIDLIWSVWMAVLM